MWFMRALNSDVIRKSFGKLGIGIELGSAEITFSSCVFSTLVTWVTESEGGGGGGGGHQGAVRLVGARSGGGPTCSMTSFHSLYL